MQLTQNVGTYAGARITSKLFDGRNCTVREIFPYYPGRLFKRGIVYRSWDLVWALWKSAKTQVTPSSASELNDSRLLRANQFVCHTPPANLPCKERVRKIKNVEYWDENY
jgi:hypothetical protein